MRSFDRDCSEYVVENEGKGIAEGIAERKVRCFRRERFSDHNGTKV